MPTLTITVTNAALARIQAAVGDIRGNGPATAEEVSEWLREIPKELVRSYEHRVAIQAALGNLPVPIETTSQSALEAKSFVEDVEPEQAVSELVGEATPPIPVRSVAAAVPKQSKWSKFKGWFKRK